MDKNPQNVMNFGNFFNFYLVQVVKIYIKLRACSGKDLGFVGSIFNIEATRAANQDPDDPIKRHLRLKVNYHPEAITLKKESDNIRGKGHRIPLQILNKAQCKKIEIKLSSRISGFFAQNQVKIVRKILLNIR